MTFDLQIVDLFSYPILGEKFVRMGGPNSKEYLYSAIEEESVEKVKAILQVLHFPPSSVERLQGLFVCR